MTRATLTGKGVGRSAQSLQMKLVCAEGKRHGPIPSSLTSPRGGGLKAQEIVDLTQCHNPTVSRVVVGLEVAGRVLRSVSPRDKRTSTLQLTEAGQCLFQRFLPSALAFEKSLFDRFTTAETAALRKGSAALKRVLTEPKTLA